jgi:hypothetical protein
MHISLLQPQALVYLTHLTFIIIPFLQSDSSSFFCVEEMCVTVSKGSITSNATGLDGISLIFIKLFLPLILPVLTQLFNFILFSFIFSLAWMISNVVLFPKVNSLTGKSYYRSISILPVLA